MSKLRLEIAPPSGQLGGDEVSGGSRSSHHAGNRAVKRCRIGDSAPVVLWATAGGRCGDSAPKRRAGNRTKLAGRFRTEASFGYPDGVWARKDSGPSHCSGNRMVIASRRFDGQVTRATGRFARRGVGNESRLGEPGSDEGFVRRRCGRQARKLEQAGSAETLAAKASRGQNAGDGVVGRARKRRFGEETSRVESTG